MFADRGSFETPSELCETPCSPHSQSRKKDRQREYQKQKRAKEMYLVDDIKESSANINKEENTCNKDHSEPLKDTQIENNTEENIDKINVNENEKDKGKECSREDRK